MPKLSYADLVHHWEQLLLGLSASAPARPRRSELETAFGQAGALHSRMDLLRSDLQQASPGLQEKMTRGKELADVVRSGHRRRRQSGSLVVPI